MHGTADMAGGLQQVQQRSQQSPGPMQVSVKRILFSARSVRFVLSSLEFCYRT